MTFLYFFVSGASQKYALKLSIHEWPWMEWSKRVGEEGEGTGDWFIHITLFYLLITHSNSPSGLWMDHGYFGILSLCIPCSHYCTHQPQYDTTRRGGEGMIMRDPSIPRHLFKTVGIKLPRCHDSSTQSSSNHLYQVHQSCSPSIDMCTKLQLLHLRFPL